MATKTPNESSMVNAYAAKRLMLMLEKGMKDFEAKFGELKV